MTSYETTYLGLLVCRITKTSTVYNKTGFFESGKYFIGINYCFGRVYFDEELAAFNNQIKVKNKEKEGFLDLTK